MHKFRSRAQVAGRRKRTYVRRDADHWKKVGQFSTHGKLESGKNAISVENGEENLKTGKNFQIFEQSLLRNKKAANAFMSGLGGEKGGGVQA